VYGVFHIGCLSPGFSRGRGQSESACLSKWIYSEVVPWGAVARPSHPQGKPGNWNSAVWLTAVLWDGWSFSSLPVSPRWSNMLSFSPGCDWVTPPAHRLFSLVLYRGSHDWPIPPPPGGAGISLHLLLLLLLLWGRVLSFQEGCSLPTSYAGLCGFF
jgi:hypothetical protein